MNFNDIQAGTYLATPVRAWVGASSVKKTPYIEVEFSIESLGATIRWTGYLSDKTKERTLGVMVLLDWNGDEHFADGSLNVRKEVQLVVEREIGQDGKERPKVQWVNAVSRIPESKPELLKGMNIKEELANLRTKLGVKAPPEPAKLPGHPFSRPTDPAFDSNETIPF